jgi:hypothetical protein
MGFAAGPVQLIVDEAGGSEDLGEAIVRAVDVTDRDNPFDAGNFARVGGDCTSGSSQQNQHDHSRKSRAKHVPHEPYYAQARSVPTV